MARPIGPEKNAIAPPRAIIAVPAISAFWASVTMTRASPETAFAMVTPNIVAASIKAGSRITVARSENAATSIETADCSGPPATLASWKFTAKPCKTGARPTASWLRIPSKTKPIRLMASFAASTPAAIGPDMLRPYFSTSPRAARIAPEPCKSARETSFERTPKSRMIPAASWALMPISLMRSAIAPMRASTSISIRSRAFMPKCSKASAAGPVPSRAASARYFPIC